MKVQDWFIDLTSSKGLMEVGIMVVTCPRGRDYMGRQGAREARAEVSSKSTPSFDLETFH